MRSAWPGSYGAKACGSSISANGSSPALVRPLLWLFIFAAGFRQVLGVSIIPPYKTYVLYEVYITPGLLGMIQLFNGMQSSLSMVYDREMGNMRTLLVSPLPRWFLLVSKLVAGVAVGILQVYVFLAVAWFWEVRPPPMGYLYILPALILTGLMLGSVGLLLSSLIKQLENFAGVMNFVIFPLFFASSALYPLWRVREVEPAALQDLPVQPVHPCRRADPLCDVWPGQLPGACRRGRLHRAVPWRRPFSPMTRPAASSPAAAVRAEEGSRNDPPCRCSACFVR